MNIAFAMINCNRRDGSARAVNEVAERLAVRGHAVHLYARKAEELDLDKVRWHRIAGVGWPEVADFLTYQMLADYRLSQRQKRKDLAYDIVHSIGCNSQRANVVTIQNIQPAKKVILERIGTQEKISAPRRLTRWLYLRVTSASEKRLYTHRSGRPQLTFLPVSKGVEAELRKHYDIGSARVKIIPNAADTVRFRPLSNDERCAWRYASGVDNDALVMLFAGGEWARKGLDYAIKALALVREKSVRLFVAGDDPDRERFVHLARELGCSDRVIFGGFRRDIETAMGAADLFLFPSWYEAFSLATIEAAACGLPVVATKINGTEDFVQPGVNGEFIERDAENIASVLNSTCANHQTLREMGARGRRLVEQHYTWDRVAMMTEEAYRISV